MEYTYDPAGNITEIEMNGEIIRKYTYDDLNQMTGEYDTENEKKYIYTYDTGGNIIKKET